MKGLIFYVFINLTRYFSIWIQNQQASWREQGKVMSFHSSLYTWAQPWRCQISQGSCPLLAPFLTRTKGSDFIPPATPRARWLHQRELTSLSSKDSASRYYVETKFLQGKYRRQRRDWFLMPLFTVELTKLSRVYVDYVYIMGWMQMTS